MKIQVEINGVWENFEGSEHQNLEKTRDIRLVEDEQCFCPSYYDDDNKLQDCKCGKCGDECKHKLGSVNWICRECDRDVRGVKPSIKIEKLKYPTQSQSGASTIGIISRINELTDAVNKLQGDK